MTEKELDLCKEVFATRLPNADFNSVEFDALPYRMRRNIDGTEDLGLGLEILHEDSTKTFVGESSSLEVIYVNDRDKRNKYLGEGVVYLQNSDDDLYIPVVGFTFTAKTQRNHGLGTRRLIVMDTLSRIVFKQPLHSTLTPRPTQKSIWEKLVKTEAVEILNWQGTQRFKFL